MVNFTVATNYDPFLLVEISRLNKLYSKNKIVEVYGSLPRSITGSGRAATELPPTSRKELEEHIQFAQACGLKFNYLMNGMNKELSANPSALQEIRGEINFLLDAGTDSLTVSDDYLIHILRSEYPHLELHLSVIAGADTTEEVKKYTDFGVKAITLNQHTVNRDFKRIEDLVYSAPPEIELRLYANVSCLDHCPRRTAHYQYLSQRSQQLPKGEAEPGSEINPYLFWCASTYLNNPIELLKSPFIRPEDISAYEQMGIGTFKLSDRRETTTALVSLYQAYLSGEFHGNLFALLFREGRKWARGFEKGESRHFPEINIENDALSRLDFFSQIKNLNGKRLEEFYQKATTLAVRVSEADDSQVNEKTLGGKAMDIQIAP